MDLAACSGIKQTYREGKPPFFRFLLLGIPERARKHIVQFRHWWPRECLGVTESEEVLDCWREVGDHSS